MERKLSLHSNGDIAELYSEGDKTQRRIGFHYSGWFDKETFEREYIQGKVEIGAYRRGIEELCNHGPIDEAVRISGNDGCLKLTKINGRVILLGFENSRLDTGVMEVDLAPEEFMKLIR